MISPVFEELSKKYSGIRFAKVDVDNNRDAAEFAGITAMPTFQVWKNGQKQDEFRGASPDSLTKTLEKWGTKTA